MRKVKSMFVVVMVFACLCASFGFVSAAWYAGAQYQDTITTGGKLTGEDPSAGSGIYSARMESVLLTEQGYLVGLYAYFKIYGFETYVDCTVGARVEYLTSNATLNSNPNGTIVDTSNMTISSGSMNNETYTLFYFTFDGDVWIADASKLAIIVFVDSASMISDNHCVMWGMHGTGGYAGYSSSYVNGAWGVLYASGDPWFILALSDVGGTEPTPTPSPSSTASSGLSDSALNTLLGNLFWWLAVLIIVLGPAFVFGVLFRGGTWGFLVGLLAGAGLGYWLMPTLVPLWLVVGVVFAVAAMAWSAMGRSS